MASSVTSKPSEILCLGEEKEKDPLAWRRRDSSAVKESFRKLGELPRTAVGKGFKAIPEVQPDKLYAFPGKGEMASCLMKRMPNSDYLNQKGMIDAVATTFADEEKTAAGVGRDVHSTLINLNQQLHLPGMAMAGIEMHFEKTVKGCAK